MYVMYLLLIVSLLYLGARCQKNIQSKFVSEKVLCDLNDRLNRGYSSLVRTIRSSTECVSLCARDKSCIGASIDQRGSCFHHRECPLISGCTVEEKNHRYLTKYCAHGTWDPATRSCECVDGFYGDRCNQCYRSCDDLPAADYYGYHMVYIDPDQNGAPFRVKCDVWSAYSSSSSTYVLSNMGSMNFNKTWEDYVNGFYYDANNFWSGLYAMHRLTVNDCQGMEIGIYFPGNEWYYRSYKSVFVHNETNKYRFTLINQNLEEWPVFSIGDCLGPLHNLPFSTWDADNDGNTSENCAARAGSGWWYGGCDCDISSRNAVTFIEIYC